MAGKVSVLQVNVPRHMDEFPERDFSLVKEQDIEKAEDLLIKNGETLDLKSGKYFFRRVEIEGLLLPDGDLDITADIFILREGAAINLDGVKEHPNAYELNVRSNQMVLDGVISANGFSPETLGADGGRGGRVVIGTHDGQSAKGSVQVNGGNGQKGKRGEDTLDVL